MDLPRARHSFGHFLHAAAQTSWRAQRQWIGSLLLIALALAMVAALYLDVTSQAAIVGRQIQDLTQQLQSIELANADLRSRLAEMSSIESMQQRAALLGYAPVDSNKLQYVQVPGYEPPAPEILIAAEAWKPGTSTRLPEYTESLISWFGRRLNAWGSAGQDLP